MEIRSKKNCLKLMGSNANSLISKLESLENVLCVELDQETWLCRTHLDTFWVYFGPYWTNLDYLDHSVFLDKSI